MVRISRERLDMEDGRIDNAVLKDYSELAQGSSSTVFTGSSYTINIANGNTYTLVLNANCLFTFANPTASGNVCSFTLILRQDQVGGWEVAWPTGMRWQGGITPNLTATPGNFDIITFFTVNGGTNWVGAQVSRDHLNGVGELWSWGRNDSANGKGNLASGTVADRSSPAQVGSLTNWASLTVGNPLSLGVKSDATLWSWGRNDHGQLGLNDGVSRSSPAQVGTLTAWSQQTSAWDGALAIQTNGTLWSWGFNHLGQLGSNATVSRSSPTQVGTLNNWKRVASGHTHSVAVKTDGTLWSWGDNGYGQLGQNTATTLDRSSPTIVGALTTWIRVSAGHDHTLALKSDGTLWTWGTNEQGQLGRQTPVTAHTSSPTQVGSLTNWAQITSGYSHNAAIKTDGTLWAWGMNNYGQLGDSSVANRSSPVQVGALTSWMQVSAGYVNTIALKKDGTAWLWGRNQFGQLGRDNTTSRSSPVQIGSANNWSFVKTGGASGGSDFMLTLRHPPSWVDPSVTAIEITASDNFSTTLTSRSVGSAYSDRVIVGFVHAQRTGSTPRTLTSATIGGVSATILSQQGCQTSQPNSNMCALIAADVPTGTTTDITLTWSGAVDVSAVALLSLANVQSLTAVDTATDSFNNSPGDNTVSAPLDKAQNGITLGVGTARGGSTSMTWSNLDTELNEVSDGTFNYAAAYELTSSSQTDVDVTLTFGSNRERAALALATLQ